MDLAITKISKNGQVVIPADIRREAGIESSTQFMVFNDNGNILLKRLDSDTLKDDLILIEKINRSEDEIVNGKYTKVDAMMSDKEIDDLLME